MMTGTALAGSDWEPFGIRTGERTPAGSLYTGVPAWLQTSLVEWVKQHVFTFTSRYYIGSVETEKRVNRDVLLRMERRLQRGELAGVLDVDGLESWFRLRDRLKSYQDLFLEVVDFLLFDMSTGDQVDGQAAAEAGTELASILREAGSAYTVEVDPAGKRLRLSLALDPSVRRQAEEAMSHTDRGARHLEQAWSALYGLRPSAGEGYREAVRAVESIAKPILLPNSDRATLGTMITTFRDGMPKDKWSVVLQPTHGVDPAETVLRMMQMLWHGEYDRHGTDDETIPLNVSVEEARAALHLALTLVQWFRSGAVAAR